ncbi:MAG: Omp28-related outer membrane protein [Chitinophagaceae bacterium]
MNKKLLFSLFATAVASSVFAQSSVTTNGVKNVLVEESTGAWCQYCPDGAVYLANLIAANSQVIGVSIHGGSSTDSMKFADGDIVTSTYFTAFPLGAVDRVPYGSPAVVGISRSSWSSAATARAAVAPDFDVTLNHGLDVSTGVITAEVKAKVLKTLTGNYNLNVYIIEDSVKGFGHGWDQVNFYNTQSGHTYFGAGNPIVGFNHMHVVRAMLGGAFGTTGLIKPNNGVGSTISKTYTYTLPVGYKYKHFKLVALVEKDDTDPTKRSINNAVEANLVNTKFKLSIGTTPAVSGLEISPNPTSGTIKLVGTFVGTANILVHITNTMGQVVFKQEIPYTSNGVCNASMDISALSSGVYFVNVRSVEGQNIIRVAVQH